MKPNWVFLGVLGVAGAVALAAIVTAAELHGRHRTLKQSRAIGAAPALDSLVAAALHDFAATVHPSPDGLARIRARTQRRAA